MLHAQLFRAWRKGFAVELSANRIQWVVLGAEAAPVLNMCSAPGAVFGQALYAWPFLAHWGTPHASGPREPLTPAVPWHVIANKAQRHALRLQIFPMSYL